MINQKIVQDMILFISGFPSPYYYNEFLNLLLWKFPKKPMYRSPTCLQFKWIESFNTFYDRWIEILPLYDLLLPNNVHYAKPKQQQTKEKSNDFSDPETVQKSRKIENQRTKKVHKLCFIILGSLLEINEELTLARVQIASKPRSNKKKSIYCLRHVNGRHKRIVTAEIYCSTVTCFCVLVMLL